MKAFYEDVWAELPEDPKPWAWERRRALLLAEASKGERVLDLGCGSGASSPRCSTRAPTPSASSWPRPRSSARGATFPARSSTRLAPTARSRSRTRASISSGAPRCSSTCPTPPGCCRRRGASCARAAACSSPRPRTSCRAARDRAAALGRALRPARPARALLQPPLAGAGARHVRVRGGPPDQHGGGTAGRRGRVRRWSPAPARRAWSSRAGSSRLRGARGLEEVRGRSARRGSRKYATWNARAPSRGPRGPTAGSARAAATSRSWRAAGGRALERLRSRRGLSPRASATNASSNSGSTESGLRCSACAPARAAAPYVAEVERVERRVLGVGRAHRLQRRPARQRARARRPRRRAAAAAAAPERRGPRAAPGVPVQARAQRPAPGDPAGAQQRHDTVRRARTRSSRRASGTPKIDHDRGHRQQPDPLGVEGQPAIAPPQPGRAHRRDRATRRSRAATAPSPTSPRSASVCTP